METKQKLTQEEIGQKFVEIGNNILKASKEYGEITPELQNIFEYTFKSYLDIVKYIQEAKQNINVIDIEKHVFSKIFKNMKFEKNLGNINSQESCKTCSPQTNQDGFNPNFTPGLDGIDMDLLQSLKENINNVRTVNKESNMQDYVNKVKEEYKTKE
jgi:hypothetical protein